MRAPPNVRCWRFKAHRRPQLIFKTSAVTWEPCFAGAITKSLNVSPHTGINFFFCKVFLPFLYSKDAFYFCFNINSPEAWKVYGLSFLPDICMFSLLLLCRWWLFLTLKTQMPSKHCTCRTLSQCRLWSWQRVGGDVEEYEKKGDEKGRWEFGKEVRNDGNRKASRKVRCD